MIIFLQFYRNDKTRIQMEESILSDKDREKKIDYVLVTELFSSLEDDGKDFDKELNQKRKKIEIFLENLREKRASKFRQSS